jgi:hypothetical protein
MLYKNFTLNDVAGGVLDDDALIRPKLASLYCGLSAATLYREVARGKLEAPIKVLGDGRNQPSAFRMGALREYNRRRIPAAKAEAR